ncbi:hypothetical protein B0J12DRAFT_693137 [Macrophomina phaseolina]|uniref:Uncharacterized protein n=1 Tax=Macrophomina phaseolina TaxID=35725 RepID=A0ABQ8GTX6_9PEZI|nr:hypothetical protein B0J12DRAFT_693137 [Macrophomina phaseolina]
MVATSEGSTPIKPQKSHRKQKNEVEKREATEVGGLSGANFPTERKRTSVHRDVFFVKSGKKKKADRKGSSSAQGTEEGMGDDVPKRPKRSLSYPSIYDTGKTTNGCPGKSGGSASTEARRSLFSLPKSKKTGSTTAAGVWMPSQMVGQESCDGCRLNNVIRRYPETDLDLAATPRQQRIITPPSSDAKERQPSLSPLSALAHVSVIPPDSQCVYTAATTPCPTMCGHKKFPGTGCSHERFIRCKQSQAVVARVPGKRAG